MVKYLVMHNGKPCLAKTAYTLAVVTTVAVIAYNTYTGMAVDYSGMAVWIGAVGAVYFGRSHDKK